MPNALIIQFCSLGVVFLTAAVGAFRFKLLDIAARIFWIYTVLGIVVEVVALYAAYEFKNNMPVYGIYGFLEFGLMSLYFNYSIDWLRRYRLGYAIGVVGILLGIANSYFFQPLSSLNSYFLYFEGTAIIALSLFSFFRMLLLPEELEVFRLRHFWFPVILCFYWSFTFFNWGMYEYFAVHMRESMALFNISIRSVGVITYLAIAVVFWKYPKLRATYE